LRPRFDSLRERGHVVRWLDGADSEALSGSPLYRHGGYLLEGAGHIDPLKYILALAAGVQNSGGQLFSNSAVTSAKRIDGHWSLTANGKSIRARHVVLASNAYMEGPGRVLRGAMLRIQPWAVATGALDQTGLATVIPGDQLLGDNRMIPYFFRKDRSGSVVMPAIAGARPFGPPSNEEMENLLARTFPQLARADIAFRWNGQTAFMRAEMPRLALIEDGMWTAFGYGRGVGMATVLGAVLADACTGVAPDKLAMPVLPLRRTPLVEPLRHLFPIAASIMARKER